MSDAPASFSSSNPPDRGSPAWLRRDAEQISGALPPLMAQAERLAASVVAGVHGRRRSGPGETFWQYRQAMPGDPATSIDWRRSARSEQLFIREMEWEAAQTVSLWADDARSMDYRSKDAPRTKGERAKLLTLALGVLLTRGGERTSLLGTRAERAATGEPQLLRMATELARRTPDDERPDFGAPPRTAMIAGGQAVFLSDFMGPREEIFPSLIHAAERGVRGAYVQIVDPAEETFPFDGRLVLRSLGGSVEFETHRARGLREAYLQRLAERRADLNDTARRCGWRCLIHRTDESPRKALLWLYGAIGGA